jgi:hypothetical protein
LGVRKKAANYVIEFGQACLFVIGCVTANKKKRKHKSEGNVGKLHFCDFFNLKIWGLIEGFKLG